MSTHCCPAWPRCRSSTASAASSATESHGGQNGTVDKWSTRCDLWCNHTATHSNALRYRILVRPCILLPIATVADCESRLNVTTLLRNCPQLADVEIEHQLWSVVGDELATICADRRAAVRRLQITFDDMFDGDACLTLMHLFVNAELVRFSTFTIQSFRF